MLKASDRGFTLIELLIVISIVAILAVVVILTINPAELLRQARDSSRISDFSTIKTAIAIYLTDVGTPSLGTSGTCYMSATSTSANCGFSGTYTATSGVVANAAKVDGTGWIPVNFNAVSAGSPMGSLPQDPTNVSPYVYRYVASTTNTTFKLLVPMESLKYTTGVGSSTPANDGGASSTAYETGTSLGL